MSARVLIACVGNRLRSDDGVGPVVGDLLTARGLPESVVVEEIGIGGIHLVQSLLGREFDALIVVDCADHGRDPGTVMTIDPDVLDVESLTAIEKYDYLADMHYTKPERAFALARALGVLPERFQLVGVQPQDAETLHRGLTPVVDGAVAIAADEVLRIVVELQSGVDSGS
ncbi:MAG: hydrogenase maturation protease [Acidimicrobiia bacterium]|nr:hydrogenase maturation protease [Acidimicrobiia bacterium]